MPVRKLYWEDAYLREFDSTVVAAEGNRVCLESTAFLPMGGGFVGDSGFLGSFRVTDTQKEGEDSIIHLVENYTNFNAGDSVHGIIDWDRRYRSMKMHTAAHALSAVFNNEAGAKITGNQIRPDESRIDFSLGNMDRKIINSFVDRVNEAIAMDLDVKTYFMPREEAEKIPDVVKLAGTAPPDTDTFRIVEIVGLDVQACGAVNVKSLGEIGRIVPLRYENKGKSNRRLYFTLDE